jgi:UDP-N-acetylbacillosamine transaminase
MNKKVFLSPPHMSNKELDYIKQVFDSNYIAPLGEFVDRFEDSIKDYTKSKYALALNSGTSAIHLALRVLGVKSGDEVFASTFTFIGSITPILYQGAIPIFIDSDESWNISPILLEEQLQKRKLNKQKMPKALIITHLYGQLADIEKIANICRQYNVFLIEDCAESLGGFYKDTHCGLFGDMGIFSFNGNKIITTSGGGALISNNQDYIKQARYLSTVAKEDNLNYYEHNDYGYNYRLSNVLASIGVAQMEVLEDRVVRKREIFDMYKRLLSDCDIQFMPELDNTRGNRWLSTILFKDSYKPFLRELEKNGYEARALWKPMHMQPIFKENKAILNGVSQDLFSRGLCLPSGTNMKEEDIINIANIIKGIL